MASGNGGGISVEPTGRSCFWCHQCEATTSARADSDELTCRACGSGFIEEIPEEHEPPREDDDSWDDMDVEGSQNERLEPLFQQLLTSALFPPVGLHGQGDRGGRPSTRSQGGTGPTRHRIVVGAGPGDQFLQMLLSNLTGVPLGGGLGPVLPLYGNPGDYAWGSGGLDAVVTTLLNQIDGTGPPPMGSDNIEKIPKVNITSEQVESKLQCSVCWDDFKIDEEVRKLNCEHVFHDGCIVPWLKLHATCPVCRKPQGETTEQGLPRPGETNSSETASTSRGPSTATAPETMSSIGNTISTVLNQFLGIASPASTSTSSATPAATSASSSSTNAPRREDDNNSYEDMDLE